MVCSGDAIGRYIFRIFYDDWDVSVVDSTGSVYCCGSAQNCDSYIYTCGDMRICDECYHKHDKNRCHLLLTYSD